MQKFIEQNRRFLLIYFITARIIGWVVVSVGCLAAVGHSVALCSRLGNWQLFSEHLSVVPWRIISSIPIGLLALGLAQFIKYVMDPEYKPGWTLRNAEQILYLYAGIIMMYWAGAAYISVVRIYSGHELLIRLLFVIVFAGVRVLAVASLGLVLHRIMPVIEESRTLV